MAVYVDNAYLPYGRMVMCHMMADDEEELHAMAKLIGVDRRWYQIRPVWGSHYDVSKGMRALAVEHGAIELTSKELVTRFSPIKLRLALLGLGEPPTDEELTNVLKPMHNHALLPPPPT